MPLILNGTTGISGVDGSAGTPSYQGTDTNTGIFYPAADTLSLSTSGTERMRISSTGLVGIGTNNPQATLDISRSAGGQSLQIIKPNPGTGGANIYMQSDSGSSGNPVQFNWGAEAYTSGVTGGGPANAYPLTFYTNSAERMRIDFSGKVSIGTTSVYNSATGTQLSVNGGMEARGHVRSYYSATLGIANGASQTLMSLPAGSFGGPIAGILNVVQRNDNVGDLTMSTYLVSGFGGSGANFTAVTTRVYGSGCAFTIAGTASGGDLVIAITNTSGLTSTSINFSFLSLQSNAITYAF